MVILTFQVILTDFILLIYSPIVNFSGHLELMKKTVKENEQLFTIWGGPFPVVFLTQPQDLEVGNKLILGSQMFINNS